MRDLLRFASYVDGDLACSCSVDRPAAPALVARSAVDGYPAPLLPLLHRIAPLLPRALLLLCGPLRLMMRAPPRPPVVTAPSAAS